MNPELPVGRILLLVDGSRASDAAVAFAGTVAQASRATVTAFSVVRPESVRSELEKALAAAVAVLVRTGAPVETAIVEGSLVAEVLKKVASGYDLTILAARRRRGWEGERLSLRLWKLAKAVPTPVVLVPEEGGGKVRTLLFCSGGAHYIEKGAEFAAGFARTLNAQAVLFHVLPATLHVYRDTGHERPSPAEVLSGDSRLARRLRSQVHTFESQGVPCTVHLEEGASVADSIFTAAQEVAADLIVVGSSPTRGRLRTYILGDVTREVAARSRLPLLIVRSEQIRLWKDLWRILWEPAPAKRPSRPSAGV